MSEQTQKVACPAFLRKRLQAHRVGTGDEQSYLLTDKITGTSYRLEQWQFFLLEVLPGCENFEKLASVFEDRFGHKITQDEFEGLLHLIANNKLFALSATMHPMLAEFQKSRINAAQGNADKTSPEKAGSSPQKQPQGPAPKTGQQLDELPAGIRDALGFDEKTKKGFKLFNPTGLIKLLHPVLAPFKLLIYLLPTVMVAAIFLVTNNLPLVEQGLTRLFNSYSFIEHILFGMVTVNLAATITTAVVAYGYRASVIGFCIVFYLGIIPRFMARISHVQQLSRRERMWLHAAPLLLRLGLMSTGIMVWFTSLERSEFISMFALSVAAISTISVLITVNPLIKSNGYHLLSAFLNEPYLKGKSYKFLLNKFKGNVYKEADNNILIAYGLASTVFMICLIGLVLWGLGYVLKMQFGTAGILMAAVIALVLLGRMVTKFKEIQEAYERSSQFEKWRSRSFAPKNTSEPKTKSTRTFFSYLRYSVLALFIFLMFVPYPFYPGGQFIILPLQKQEITADISGLITSIEFDGGEFVKKGTVIARLDHSEFTAQKKVYAARIQQQKHIIDDLKSKPRPEEVELAKAALEVMKTHFSFSKAKIQRLTKLYEEGATSLEELEEARKQFSVDQDMVEEKRLNLEVVKLGTPPDEIAAAEAKLVALEEQLQIQQNKIDRSVLYMPFDGKLVTMQLKQKIGSYLEKGVPLSVVENSRQVMAQIEIPESDIGYITKNSQTIIRPMAMQEQDFHGVVTAIAPTVEKKRFGKVVQVNTLIDNQNEMLKTGMTGYAKIESTTQPAWQVFSLALVRFFRVEVWSWIP